MDVSNSKQGRIDDDQHPGDTAVPDPGSQRRGGATRRQAVGAILGGLAGGTALPLLRSSGSVSAAQLSDFHISAFDFMSTDQVADVKAGTRVEDVTGPLKDAIDAARTQKRAVFLPMGTYWITDTLVLSSVELARVDLYGEVASWYDQPTSTLWSDMNKPTLSCVGTTKAYCNGPMVRDLAIVADGTGEGNVGISCSYSGGLRTKNVLIKTNSIGIEGNDEVISAHFEDTHIESKAAYGVAGYRGRFRNVVWTSGRVSGFLVGLDALLIDSGVATGLDMEFNAVHFRHSAIGSMTFVGCHFETSHCLMTNAERIPYPGTTKDWTDAETGSGAPTIGSIRFVGGIYYPLQHPNSNAIVIKGSPAFQYTLSIESMLFAGQDSDNRLIVGGSFVPGSTNPVPSGTRLTVSNCLGLQGVFASMDAFSSKALSNSPLPSPQGSSNSNLYSYVSGTYTPEVTGSVASMNGVKAFGRYQFNGQVLSVYLDVFFDKDTVFTSNGEPFYFSLPPEASPVSKGFGVASAVRQGVNEYFGFAHFEPVVGRIQISSTDAVWKQGYPATFQGEVPGSRRGDIIRLWIDLFYP